MSLALLLTLLSGVVFPSTASAHAELRQASPDRGEVVGGAIHSITMQFFDLDVTKPQTATVFDPAGNELPNQVNREDQRLVIALVDPIMTRASTWLPGPPTASMVTSPKRPLPSAGKKAHPSPKAST